MTGGKERRWRCHYDSPIIKSAVKEYRSAPAGYAVRVWAKWKIQGISMESLVTEQHVL